MARDSHSAFKAFELLPYYMVSALEEVQRRKDERRKPTLPAIIVAMFGALVSLGVYQRAGIGRILLLAFGFLVFAGLAHFGGTFVVRYISKWKTQNNPLLQIKADEGVRDLADTFNRFGINELLLSDGLISCSEQTREEKAANAFFVSEGVLCLNRAADTIAALASSDDVARKGIRFDPPLRDTTPSSNAVDEYRIRWAVDFAFALAERLRSRLLEIEIPGEERVRRDIEFAVQSKLAPSLQLLDRLKVSGG